MASITVRLKEGTYAVRRQDAKQGERYLVTRDGSLLDPSTGNLVPEIETEEPYAKAELETLKELAEVAASHVKNKRDSFCLADLAEEIDALVNNDVIETVEIDERDAKNMMTIYEALATKRPLKWTKYGRGALRQLDKESEK